MTDGGDALVLMSAERAADLDLRHPPGTVLGSGESSEGPGPSSMEHPTTFAGFRVASATVLSEVELTTDDVDHVRTYDAYARIPLLRGGGPRMRRTGRGRRLHRERGHPPPAAPCR
ncbi:hypothetical protein [Streptomyces canus]|uniref:hypothetical protein n=1 Tax=Streptomyces canus TaxID=58343 RepID=UPI002E2AA6C1|nr:hypothetical protein [Streptomyces canus]